MCQPKSSGILPGFLIGRGQQTRQAKPCSCEQHQQPRKTATDKGRDFLAWVGGICAASAVGTGALGHALGIGVHVLIIAVGVVLGLAVAGGGWLLLRRVRSLQEPQIAPWLTPALQEGTRTTVTDVRVRAIGPSGTARTGVPRRRPSELDAQVR